MAVLWHHTPESDKRDLGQAVDEILAGAIELLGAEMGTIRLLDTDQGKLKIEARRGFSQEYLKCFGEVVKEGGSPCCRAVWSAERIVIEDVEADARFIPFRPMARGAGYRALQSTPIMNREGMPLGSWRPISVRFTGPISKTCVCSISM